MANWGLISGTSYSPKHHQELIPELRTGVSPEHSQMCLHPTHKQNRQESKCTHFLEFCTGFMISGRIRAFCYASPIVKGEKGAPACLPAYQPIGWNSNPEIPSLCGLRGVTKSPSPLATFATGHSRGAVVPTWGLQEGYMEMELSPHFCWLTSLGVSFWRSNLCSPWPGSKMDAACKF